MKKIEIVLLIGLILGLIMTIFHLPGSNILTIISLFLLSMLYFYLGFAIFNNIRFRKVFQKKSYKGKSTSRIIIGIGTGLALSVSIIGILFKFQLWPGETVQLGIGLFGLGIIILISLFNLKKDPDKYYLDVLKRAIIIATISIFAISIPTKVLLDWRFPNNPEYVQALLDSKTDPSNPELWENVEKERFKMENGNK